MRLSTIAAGLFSIVAVVAAADQQVHSGTSTSAVISQYGDTFKNAGGNILHDTVNVYVIFYGNWNSTQSQQEQTTFMHFIDNISQTPWFGLLKKYTDNNGNAVTGPLNLAAAVNDAGSHSLQLTNAIHKNIVTDAVNSGYLSPVNQLDSNGIYVIMGGPDVKDSEFCKINCGYNGYTDQFQYIFIGYPSNCPERCIPKMNKDQSPNNSPAMDAAITIFSHEIQDILTDPRGDGWEIKAPGDVTFEVADFCSSEGTSQEQFGNLTTSPTGTYNLEVNGGKYLVQTIFDLEKKQCLLS